MFCTNCGNKVNQGERFCSSCGSPIQSNDQNIEVTETKKTGEYICPVCGSNKVEKIELAHPAYIFAYAFIWFILMFIFDLETFGWVIEITSLTLGLIYTAIWNKQKNIEKEQWKMKCNMCKNTFTIIPPAK